MKTFLAVSVFTSGEVAHEWTKSSYPKPGFSMTSFDERRWAFKAPEYLPSVTCVPVLCHEDRIAQMGAAPSAWDGEWKGWGLAKIQLIHRLRDKNIFLHMNFHPHQQPIHLSSVTSIYPSLLESRFHEGRKFFCPVSTGSTASRTVPGTEQTLNKYKLNEKYYQWQKLTRI